MAPASAADTRPLYALLAATIALAIVGGAWASDRAALSASHAWIVANEPILATLAVASLSVLGAGFLLRSHPRRHDVRMAGWILFSAYWPLQAAGFFLQRDEFNAYATLLSPVLFGYLAYHEWLSKRWGEDPSPLRWIAGTAFVAGATYFAIYKMPPVTDFIIHQVALQSSFLANVLFGLQTSVYVDPGALDPEARFHVCMDLSAVCPPGAAAYAVTIILACTAIQSIMIFVGAIYATDGGAAIRRYKAYLYTVPIIYFLNLFRNAGIVYGYKVLGLDFDLMHNWVGKGGSLLALVVIALALFRVLPELHDNVLGVMDLWKRTKPGFFGKPPGGAAPSPPAGASEV
ncbi:MAG TPA: archaeosortase A [Candidatus Thermoplasmatota archaeon]|nr:archaeosortase A [Candidatus Thermoplasmatota archaeon]